MQITKDIYCWITFQRQFGFCKIQTRSISLKNYYQLKWLFLRTEPSNVGGSFQYSVLNGVKCKCVQGRKGSPNVVHYFKAIFFSWKHLFVRLIHESGKCSLFTILDDLNSSCLIHEVILPQHFDLISP